MAHLINSMAYRGQTPWHGLGNQISDNQPLDIWLEQAGMNWQIESCPVHYITPDSAEVFNDAKVLYRSDNKSALSVVSNRYQVVQPREVLEFYRDLVELGGFEIETAGVLKGGKKLWALAKTGQELVLKGNDLIQGYLLLATACDGTLATTAQFTSVRVVCNNTLQIAIGASEGAIKVPHSTKFDAVKVKQQLGIGASQWSSFSDAAIQLAEREVHPFEARSFIINLLGNPDYSFHRQPNLKILSHVFDLYNGLGKGSTLAAANDTAWGLVNAITQYVDHERRARNSDNRLDSAWFGAGAALKQKAFEEALKLAA